MFEAFARVFIQAAQPRSAHTAVYAVKSARLSGVNELAAGLRHAQSLNMMVLRLHQAGLGLGSDLSEGAQVGLYLRISQAWSTIS